MEKSNYLVAHYVKAGLNLAKIEQQCRELTLYRRERNVLIYKLSETQYMGVYSFGVLVTYNVMDRKERSRYVRMVAKGGELEEALTVENALTDDCDVIINGELADAVEFNQIRLREFNLEKLIIIFHILAQSVAIDFLERRVEEYLGKFDKLNLSLSRHGKVDASAKEVMKTIGSAGSMMNFVIGKLSLLDKPDTVWDDKEAESLFLNMRKMYELDDRFEALRFKLSFIQDSSGRILDILDTKRGQFLELTVIFLILFEIIMAFIK